MLRFNRQSSQLGPLSCSPEDMQQIEINTQIVNELTSEMHKEMDWGAMMELVDTMTNIISPVILKETIRAVRKRLEASSVRIVLHALTVTEALVKNCGRRIHREIATDRFMSQLRKLHKIHHVKRGRDSLEITARILELIQAWGEAFLVHQKDLPLFSATYHSMRKSGIEFPTQYDESKAPVLTPPVQGESDQVSDEFAKMKPEQMYCIVNNITEMLEDMLDAVEPGVDLKEHVVIKELVDQCRRIEPKLIKIIEETAVNNSDDLAKYLQLNDSLHMLLKRYDEGKVSDSSSTVGTLTVDPLIDFVATDIRPHTTKHQTQTVTTNERKRSQSEQQQPVVIPILKPPPSDQKLPSEKKNTAPVIAFDSVEEKEVLDPFEEFTRDRSHSRKSVDPFDMTSPLTEVMSTLDLIDITSVQDNTVNTETPSTLDIDMIDITSNPLANPFDSNSPVKESNTFDPFNDLT